MNQELFNVAQALLKDAKEAANFHGNDWKTDPTLVWADKVITKLEK